MPNDGDKLPQPTPRLMTYKEVGALLRVTPKTVYNLVRRGELQAMRLGGSIRFDPSDVADFFQKSKGVPQ